MTPFQGWSRPPGSATGVGCAWGGAASSYIPDPLSHPLPPPPFRPPLQAARAPALGGATASTPLAATSGVRPVSGVAGDPVGGIPSPPPPPPDFPCALSLPGHMSSRAPVGDLSPQSSPSLRRPHPGKIPCGREWGTLNGSGSANSAFLRGAPGRASDACTAAQLLQSAKATRLSGDGVEGIRPPPPHAINPSPRGGAGRWGAPAARPQSYSAGNLGSSRGWGGDAASPGRGRRGAGR